MKNFLTTVEKWFILFSVPYIIGNPINLLLFGGSGEETYGGDNSSFLEPLISMAIYAIALFFIARRWQPVVRQLAKRGKLILFIVFLVVGSTLWSDFPDITLRRSVIFLGRTFYGIYFATRYTLKQQAQLIAWGFGVVVVMSVIFATVLRKYGLMAGIHAGAWRGIYMHKNSLGIQMSLSAAIFLMLLLGNDRKKWATWAGFVVSVVLVILSRSSTGLVSLMTLIALIPLCCILRFRWNLMVPISITTLVVCGGGGILLAGYLEDFFGSMGKDLTLTGRTDLWPYVWEMIKQRPWLGYGYEGFWRGLDSASGAIWRAVGWTPPHAHNGLLELLLMFGWVGTSIYLLGFFINFLKSLALIHVNKSPESFWPVLYLGYTILTNITEKNILGGMSWSFYIAVSLLPLSRANQTIVTQCESQGFNQFDNSHLSSAVRES
jgi:O-antigen ligase